MLLGIISQVAKAQAIRINLLDYSNAVSQESENGMYIGLGYEQNLDTKISVSLEYNYYWASHVSPDNSDRYLNSASENFQNGYYNYKYGITHPTSEIRYMSKYHFYNNVNNSWYIASSIGIKFMKYNWYLTDTSSYTSSGPTVSLPSDFETGLFEEKKTLFPVCLRLGFSNGNDGFFGDYFVGINYNLGAGKIPDSPTLKYAYPTTLSKINICYGLNIGIGWVK